MEAPATMNNAHCSLTPRGLPLSYMCYDMCLPCHISSPTSTLRHEQHVASLVWTLCAHELQPCSKVPDPIYIL